MPVSEQEYNKDRNLAFLLHDVSKRVTRLFDRQMEPFGLTRSQWGLLVYVAREPGIVQTKLADKLEIGRMAVTGLIDRMELKGLVSRRDDELDRRIKRIFLTPEAEELMPEIQASADRVGASIFTSLTSGQRQGLVHCLVSIRQQAEVLDEAMLQEAVLENG